MTGTTSRLYAEAMRLSDKERSELAAKLVASLDDPEDESVVSEWHDEVRRQLDDLRPGWANARI